MPTLEERVSELENQVRRLINNGSQRGSAQSEPWWKRHSGAFEGNPLYDEAMRLGNEYRRSQPTAADSPAEFTD